MLELKSVVGDMEWANQMADEVSKVDWEELLRRIEDENFFDKSFTSDLSSSNATKSKP
jgi:hypothetical protein